MAKLLRFPKSYTLHYSYAVTVPIAIICISIPVFFRSFFEEAGILYSVLGMNLALILMFLFSNKGRFAHDREDVIFFNYKSTHLIQIIAQTSVYLVWALYFPGVIIRIPFILYQIGFAIIFQLILSKLLKDELKFNLSLIAIVFSINFFLWIVPKYFIIQILIIPLSVLIKRFVVRDNNGIKKHIFNPSGIVMAIVAYLTILFNADISYDIRSTFDLIHHGHVFIFLAGCFAQWVGGTMSIALGSIAASLIHLELTTHYFHINAALFLGATLLITDPATSPKTGLGQLIYGTLFYFSLIAYAKLREFLGLSFGAGYDKLFFLPILNYFAPQFDRIIPFDKRDILQRGFNRRLAILAVQLVVFLMFQQSARNYPTKIDARLEAILNKK